MKEPKFNVIQIAAGICKEYCVPQPSLFEGLGEVNGNDCATRMAASIIDLVAACEWALGCLKNMPKSSVVISATRELEAAIARAKERT